MRTRFLRWIQPFLAAALVASCAPAKPTNPPGSNPFVGAPGTEHAVGISASYARKIEQERDLVGGPMASGRVGDYVIGNYKVRFVISAVDHAGGFSQTGGHIVDADLTPGGHDALNEIWAYLDNTFPRQPLYEKLEVTSSGAGAPAEITVSGVDSQAPNLEITTRYRLLPDADYLIIQTTLSNKGAETFREYELGDAVQWGMAEYYGPGVGTALKGASNLGLPWLAGTGNGVSYGWSAAGERLNGPNGGGWSDPISKTVTLLPGRTESYTRYLVVGDGDIASVLGTTFALAGEQVGMLVGSAVDEQGRAVTDARVQVDHSDGTPYAFAQTDAWGRYRIPLPQGIYKIVFSAPGRAPVGEAQEIGMGNGRVLRLEGTLGPRTTLAVTATERGKAVPAKVTVEGLGGTPDPRFGPSFKAQGAENTAYMLDGKAELALAPGRYRISVSRGIEYSLFSREITVKPGQRFELDARLTREVDTRGWYASDFHQHSSFSPDSAALPEDIVIGNLSEGIELIAGTDHDVIPDYTAALAHLGVEDTFRVISGDEITTRSWGHFNVFPMKYDASKKGNGAFQHEDRSPKEFLPEARKIETDPVLQLNHPRAGYIGFYDITEFNFDTGKADKPEGFSLEYDAIEVFNGKRVADAERAMNDWFRLLNDGHAFTATGNSDSHSLKGQERGYPRTYVASSAARPGDITDEQVKDVIKKQHRVIVTNGPFVQMWVNGQPIGSTVRSSPGKSVKVRVKVQAASWIDLDRLELVQDGKVIKTVSLKDRKNTVRYDSTLSVTADKDSWILAVVRGTGGLDPVVPADRGEAVLPLGLTNPVWIDTDGNGEFDVAATGEKTE